MKLSKRQLECVEFCMDARRRIVAVTGQAGTGKTSIIKHISEELDGLGIAHAIAAPTGKAAKRIREATGRSSITVHKLLEYGRPGDRDKTTGEALDITVPRRGRSLPFDQRVVLVDEYSMVTHELNRNLIDALPAGGRIIVFGDLSQLPPIENYDIKNADGSPFKELLARKDTAFVLEEVFRQTEGSDVLLAATNIRKGIIPRRGDKFKMHFTDFAVDKLKELVFEAQDNSIDFGSIENQILTPMKTKWIGCGPLNVMLRNLLNPNGRSELALMRHSWDDKNPVTISVGDKIVCTSNTYDMRDYHQRFTEWQGNGDPVLHSFIPTPETKFMLNGETGKVIEIYPDGGFEVDLGDRVIEIPYMYEEYWVKKGTIIDTYPQRDIDLAYALTVHKAQGSEYQNVIFVINSSIFYMLSRELMYTAVTRAKNSVQMITDQKALMTGLRVTEESKLKMRRARDAAKGSLIKS